MNKQKLYSVSLTLFAALISIIAPIVLCHWVFPAAQRITGQWILYSRTAEFCTLIVFSLDCLITYGFLWLVRVHHKRWFYIVTVILILFWVGLYASVTRSFVLDSGTGW